MMPKKSKSNVSKKTFCDPPGQDDFFEKSYEEQLEARKNTPVKCLGMDFPNDDARREYFLGELAKNLKDPEFRKIEGFPIGEDEDILALSDPPYYTACPNPWIADFISQWEAEKPEKEDDKPYHREPFATDVSEGKNDPIYNAHSYHTKVPHKAIMRYILHYTEPGDIVFDGFCGTGMTGVAAQLCGDRDTVASLGYQVKADGTILQEETDATGKKTWKPFSKLGARRAVLNDLSPAATFIAYNYNTPVDVVAFEREAKRILKEVEDECGWMYETRHMNETLLYPLSYVVWSDVFICPHCAQDVTFFSVALDRNTGKVRSVFSCEHCRADLQKKDLKRKQEAYYSVPLKASAQRAVQAPVLVNYKYGPNRYTTAPTKYDLDIIRRVEDTPVPYFYPDDRIDRDIDIWYERDYRSLGLYTLDGFFTRRNLVSLSVLHKTIRCLHPTLLRRLLFVFTGTLQIASRMSSFRYDSRNPENTAGGILKGALYIPSLSKEGRVTELFARRQRAVSSLCHAQACFDSNNVILSTSSTPQLGFADNSMDYIFIDPPFGSNIIYSELSLLWESWLRVYTNDGEEAVVHRRRKKGNKLDQYRAIMIRCFDLAFRALKPGRWLTVEFSNTQSSVWNSIQTSLQDVGFIIANVAALDKQQGSFKAVTTPTAVKQDLVISAYKPNGGFEERFKKAVSRQDAGSAEGVWEFVRTHMKYLPVTKQQEGVVQPIPERDPRILFDQMVAFYVRKGYPVPLSSQEFQVGLAQRFVPRDGMYFLPDQAAEYDKFSASHGRTAQMSLFVSDEASAIDWLRNLLRNKPQTSAEINPQFMKELGGWSKHEKPLDLRDLLNQNFLCYDGKDDVPSQIHAYLSSNWPDLRRLEAGATALKTKAKDRWYVPDPNKAGDLERLRERALLREFWEYLPEGHKPLVKLDTNADLPGLVIPQPKIPTGKRMRILRTEAVRAGFKYCWQNQDYRTIIAVAKRIPEDVLQEDPKLLMWYDQALTRLGEE